MTSFIKALDPDESFVFWPNESSRRIDFCHAAFARAWTDEYYAENNVISRAEKPRAKYKGPLDPKRYPFLVVPLNRQGLTEVGQAIVQPDYGPHLRGVKFNCTDINDLDKAKKLKAFKIWVAFVASMLNDTTEQRLELPVKSSLMLLLHGLLCAMETNKIVWFCWNGPNPVNRERAFEMKAICAVTNKGLGAAKSTEPRFEVCLDYGLQFSVDPDACHRTKKTGTRAYAKSQEETWMCVFQTEAQDGCGHLLLKNWPGVSQNLTPHITYSLFLFEWLI